MTQQQILYIHGLHSQVTANHPKYRALSQLGQVSAIAPDYGLGRLAVEHAVTRAMQACNADLLVGTSMGGWLAGQAGCTADLPFVALNPCIHPQNTLAGLLPGPSQISASYHDFPRGGRGLVIVELGDTLLDSRQTARELGAHYPVISLPGGAHPFEQLPQVIEPIARFLAQA